MSQIRSAARNSEANTKPVNQAGDQVAALAQEMLDRVAETASAAEQGLRGAAARAAEAAKGAQGRTVEAAGENLQLVRSYIERNPLTVVGVAVAVGVLLGTWARR